MSQIKYCAKCGGQLLPNAEFCASCGAPVSVLPVQVAPAAPTKRKPWFSVIAVVMIVLAFLGGASIAPERSVTVTTTYVSTSTLTKLVTTAPTVVTSGVQRVKIGQTITVLGSDKVPVEIRFTRLWYADKVGYATADKGYKFAILDVTVKNIGTKETKVFTFLGKWTVTVDRGYTYDEKSTSYLPENVRPEEVKTGYVYFEILQETAVVEFRWIEKVYVNVDIIVEP